MPISASHIIVDNGAYSMRNMGDVAMLQACVGRIRSLSPDAQISVLCTNPELLQRYCPGTRPLSVQSRDVHYESSRPTGTPWAEIAHRFKRSWSRKNPAAREWLGAYATADAVVLAGGGFLNDLNPLQTRAVLRMLLQAATAEKRVALFSQGLGPLENPEFLSFLQAISHAGGYLALRESRKGPDIGRSAGFPTDRLRITGDDAVEMAWRNKPEGRGNAVGFSLRHVDYAALAEQDFQAITSAIARVQRHTAAAAPLVPIPISFNPWENDPATIGRIAGQDAAVQAAALDEPAAAIAQAAKCRLLITGTYHAAVFALSQGIPSVCLFRSPYYRDKMAGLASQFGDGCALVDLSEGDSGTIATRIFDTAARLWERALHFREPLLSAASAQVTAANEFYGRVFASRR